MSSCRATIELVEAKLRERGVLEVHLDGGVGDEEVLLLLDDASEDRAAETLYDAYRALAGKGGEGDGDG